MLRVIRLFAALAVVATPLALVTGSVAKTSSKPSVPSCKKVSRSGMSKALGIGELKFKDNPAGNLCAWTATKKDHYDTVVAVQIVPAFSSVYDAAKAAGMKTAAKDHKEFGTLSSKHEPWKAAFFVSGTDTDAGLSPCPPKHKLPKFGPPSCSGDPEWVTFNVVGYNSKLMYSIAADAQLGDTHLSNLIYMEKQLLERKLK